MENDEEKECCMFCGDELSDMEIPLDNNEWSVCYLCRG